MVRVVLDDQSTGISREIYVRLQDALRRGIRVSCVKVSIATKKTLLEGAESGYIQTIGYTRLLTVSVSNELMPGVFELIGDDSRPIVF